MLARSITLALGLAILAAACQPKKREQGPEDVLLAFVQAMRRVHGDPEAGEAAFELLWDNARTNLKERARRASALSGRELTPGEVIVPSWFALHFVPERTSVRLDGRWAEVTMYGSGQSAQGRCIQEEDGWKVALELPPLAPIRQRETFEE